MHHLKHTRAAGHTNDATRPTRTRCCTRVHGLMFYTGIAGGMQGGGQMPQHPFHRRPPCKGLRPTASYPAPSCPRPSHSRPPTPNAAFRHPGHQVRLRARPGAGSSARLVLQGTECCLNGSLRLLPVCGILGKEVPAEGPRAWVTKLARAPVLAQVLLAGGGYKQCSNAMPLMAAPQGMAGEI